jgi:uncharacterized protein YjbI with pentapeptide repeats
VFWGATLTAANLAGGRFNKASFRGADLTAASLRGAVFENADMREARLNLANLSGADLSKAKGLTQAQLDQACGDAATKAPQGLTVRFCR